MKTISEAFKTKKLKIAYFMAGDPDLKTSEGLIEKIAERFDIIELGAPFSDPIADGITIQKAALRSMKNKITIEDLFSIVSHLRKKNLQNPIITMLYYNLILQYGLEKFADGLVKNGLNGALVPDLPLEESEELRSLFKQRNLDMPMLVAPTTSEERAKQIAEAASGFIYYVSYAGTTGSGVSLDYETIMKKVKRIQSFSKLPVAVGFGIKDRKSIDQVLSFADGAVIGSALICKMEECLGKTDLMIEFEKYLKTEF